jgi:hypothetical protein
MLGARRQWEIAGRYGSFDPSALVTANDQNEWRVGASYYYRRHGLKIQADFGELEVGGTTTTNNQEFRLQTQFIF